VIIRSREDLSGAHLGVMHIREERVRQVFRCYEISAPEQAPSRKPSVLMVTLEEAKAPAQMLLGSENAAQSLSF
jgi:hypothetical protein